MANKKNKHNKSYKKDLTTNTSYSDSISKIVKTLVVVLIIFGIFYLLTVYLTNRKSNTKKTVSEAVIQYDEIIAGTSFNMKNDKYLVVYYDYSNDEVKSSITTAISSYQDKDDHMKVYTVDMSSAFNNKFSSDVSNTNPSSVNDLKIAGPTLIKFEKNKVSDYIEGTSEIENYLK